MTLLTHTSFQLVKLLDTCFEVSSSVYPLPLVLSEMQLKGLCVALHVHVCGVKMHAWITPYFGCFSVRKVHSSLYSQPVELVLTLIRPCTACNAFVVRFDFYRRKC